MDPTSPNRAIRHAFRSVKNVRLKEVSYFVNCAESTPWGQYVVERVVLLTELMPGKMTMSKRRPTYLVKNFVQIDRRLDGTSVLRTKLSLEIEMKININVLSEGLGEWCLRWVHRWCFHQIAVRDRALERRKRE